MFRLLAKVILVLAMIPLFALAETSPQYILVSDIDDTIQLTQIHPQGRYLDFIISFLKNHDSFTGFPFLYNLLATKGVEIHYVSGAPLKLSRVSEKFLRTSGFPSGTPKQTVWVRPNLKIKTKDFKIQKIKELMEANPTTQFFFMGDNGEYDIGVYEFFRTSNKYSPRVKYISIHDLYIDGVGKKVPQAMNSYATAVEVGFDFYQMYLLSHDEFKGIVKLVVAGLESNSKSIQNRSLPNFSNMNLQTIQRYDAFLKNEKDQELKSLMGKVIDSYWSQLIENSSGSFGRSCIQWLGF